MALREYWKSFHGISKSICCNGDRNSVRKQMSKRSELEKSQIVARNAILKRDIGNNIRVTLC